MSDQQGKPVYILCGKDEFLRDQARERIISRAVGDGDPQMCVCAFDADAELATVMDELRTLPFLAPHRVVLIREADAFVSAHREALGKYFAKPVSSATLILIVNSWPGNTKLAKYIKKHTEVGEVVSCDAPSGKDLAQWVGQTVASEGKKIAPATAQLLADSVGSDLLALHCEIDKVVTYIGDRPEVTADDVRAIVSAIAAPPESFALTNCITAGDSRGALAVLSVAMNTRGVEFQLIGQIRWHLQRALQAAEELAAGRQISLRMPYQAKQAMTGMIRRRPLPKLRQDMRKLIACDLNMKSGVSTKTAMQQLVIELCS